MQKEIGKYCSQAKIRKNIESKLNSPSARVRATAQKQATRYNMEHKSYKNVTNYDPNASKNILADAKASYVSSRLGVKGTKAMRDYTLTKKQTGTQSKQQNSANTKTSNKQTQTSNASHQQSSTGGTKTPQEMFDASRDDIAPTTNANYQKALKASQGGSSATKQFYDEAKKNGKYNLAKQGADPHSGDTTSADNGNVQKLVNYMGLTGKPDVVDKKTFDSLAKGKENTVMFRGCTSVGEQQFKYGDSNRMGGIAHGTGVYFGGSADGTFKTSCGYGSNIRAMPKKNAKILEVDSRGYDSNGKKWKYTDSRGHNQYTTAIMSGYDAVRIKNASGMRTTSTYNGDYYVVWNRAAFVVEK